MTSGQGRRMRLSHQDRVEINLGGGARMALLVEGGVQARAGRKLDGKRVLVVEDEAIIALLIEDMLVDLGCAVIGPAVRVDEAIRIIADDPAIDVAILDVNVAGESVYPVAKVLAERDLPFLFATGYGDAAVGTDFKGRTVVTKPYRRNDLLSAIVEVLDRRG